MNQIEIDNFSISNFALDLKRKGTKTFNKRFEIKFKTDTEKNDLDPILKIIILNQTNYSTQIVIGSTFEDLFMYPLTLNQIFIRIKKK